MLNNAIVTILHYISKTLPKQPASVVTDYQQSPLETFSTISRTVVGYTPLHSLPTHDVIPKIRIQRILKPKLLLLPSLASRG
jgi:hypothetical protein